VLTNRPWDEKLSCRVQLPLYIIDFIANLLLDFRRMSQVSRSFAFKWILSNEKYREPQVYVQYCFLKGFVWRVKSIQPSRHPATRTTYQSGINKSFKWAPYTAWQKKWSNGSALSEIRASKSLTLLCRV
jgi:hypothetical protein